MSLKSNRWILLLLVVMFGCGKDDPTVTDLPDPGITINEVLADNGAVLADPDYGGFGDWFELYNGNSEAANIGGYYLSDDPANPGLWRIPLGTEVPAKGWLMFWADSRDTNGIAMHTNFRLSGSGGETITLYTADGDQIDLVTFGPQYTGISWGRTPDGGDQFGFFTAPTPEASNGETFNPPPAFVRVGFTPAYPTPDDEVTVVAVITDDSAELTATLYYSIGGEFLPLPMTAAPGDSFTVVIPPQSDQTTVSYYLRAADDGAAATLFPPDAPGTVATYEVQSTYLPPEVVINELLAKNDTGPEDEMGEREDWVELFNTTASGVPLGGWTIGDATATWTFPDTSIAAGGYLLIWCDNDEADGPLHANFKLSSTLGDEIRLIKDDGTPIDSIIFTAQLPDTSLGRLPDGGANWVTFPTPTPGSGNE